MSNPPRRSLRSLSGILFAGVLVVAPASAQPDVAGSIRSLLDAGDYAAALEAADAALAEPDADPGTHRFRGEALAGLLDYPAAVAAFRAAPPDAASLASLARLLALLGRDQEAAEAADALLRTGRDLAPETRAEVAAALRGAGRIATARDVLGAIRPDEPALLTLERALVAVAGGASRQDVLPMLERAASGESPPPGARLALARALADMERTDEAIPWLRRAVGSTDPDERRAARFRLGQLLIQDPEPARAAEGRRLLVGYEESRLRERRAALLLAMIAGGDLPPEEARDSFARLIGIRLDAGDPQAVRPLLHAAEAKFDGDPVFRIARARLALLERDPEAAARLLDPLVPAPGETLVGPGLAAARWLAEARLMVGDAGRAVALFDRVLEAEPAPSPRILSLAGTALALNGETGRATDLFDEALAQVEGAGRPSLLADSALVLEMTGRSEAAGARYREALRLDPGHVGAALGLSGVLAAAGRAAEAAAVIAEALDGNPGHPDLLEMRARISPAR